MLHPPAIVIRIIIQIEKEKEQCDWHSEKGVRRAPLVNVTSKWKLTLKLFRLPPTHCTQLNIQWVLLSLSKHDQNGKICLFVWLLITKKVTIYVRHLVHWHQASSGWEEAQVGESAGTLLRCLIMQNTKQGMLHSWLTKGRKTTTKKCRKEKSELKRPTKTVWEKRDAVAMSLHGHCRRSNFAVAD